MTSQRSKKLKIAFHANGATAGGLAAFVRHLSGAFIQRGHTVQFLCDYDGPFREEMEKTCETFLFDQQPTILPGFKIGPLRIPHPYAASKSVYSTRKNRSRIEGILRKAKPDIVLGNGLATAASFGNVCRQNDIKLVQCIHGIGARHNDILSMRARLSARFLNYSDTIVGVSNTCLERYRPFLNRPVKTIFNCCPPIETSDLRTDFLKKNGHPRDTSVVGSFGRITRSKGYHVMLRAAADVARDRNVVTVIGGTPVNTEESAYLSELKNLSRELGIEQHCFFLGEITPVRFFSLIDIFCHTFLGEENLSYAILESLSAGCPTIAVNRAGPTEIIEDSVSGQLIASGDPNLLANAIKKYIESPTYAEECAKNGILRIEQQFNFARWPDNWLDLFTELVAL